MSVSQTYAYDRTVSAFFDTSGAAQKATDDLIAAGVPREQITLTAGQGAGEPVMAHPDATSHRGFWDSLKDLFIPDEDRYAYAEGLRRGGYLLTVKTDETHYDRALDILDTDGAVDLDDRQSRWRTDGWSGFDSGVAMTRTDEPALFGSTDPTGMAGVPTTVAVGGPAMTDATALGKVSAAAPVESVTTTRGSSQALAMTSVMGEMSALEMAKAEPVRAAPVAGADEVIPVYEESLRVGKRDVDHGRVRVRSYVVETPVSEQVSLHSESVQIDRRPVDRAVGPGDVVFQDRVIEAEEHAEEAVVAKEARVVEEISLRKTAADTVRTITDSVRSTKVEIDDARVTGTASGVRAFSAVSDAALIKEHMDVIAADGAKIGTVDHLDGPDQIKLTKSGSPDGQHHYVPLAWIDHVDTHVHLTKTAADAKAGW